MRLSADTVGSSPFVATEDLLAKALRRGRDRCTGAGRADRLGQAYEGSRRVVVQLMTFGRMKPEEPPQPAVSPASSTPPPEPPEQHALLLYYRARARGRRQRRRRRRHLLIAVGALVAGTGLFTTVVSRTRHHEPPPLPKVVEPSAVPSRESGEFRAPASSPAAAPQGRTLARREPASPTIAPSPAPTPTRRGTSVGYQPRARLTTVRPGDAKETVFELFATRVERQNGGAVLIEGMRLRASGRSARHAHVEVAEVMIADTAHARLYWFLFGDGRLIAWGRPEEWLRATGRHQVDIDYTPAPLAGPPSRMQPRRYPRGAAASH